MKFRVVLIFLLVLPAAVRGLPAADGYNEKVVIDYYFMSGCDDCRRVDGVILPDLEAAFSGLYILNRRELTEERNFLRLIEVLDRLGGYRNEPVFMVIDGLYLLEGYGEIEERLINTLAARLDETARLPAAVVSDEADPERDVRAVIAERMRRFTVAGVLVAGLLDGINPCAVSALVFFISLLAVSKVRGRQLLACGIAFCLASFLTYFALGFGMLHAVRFLRALPVIQAVVDTAMIVVLLVLAALSFRDAFVYRAGRDPARIVLQLPGALKKRIHSFTRRRMRSGGIVIAAFVIGAAVTVVESVCTGQVYLPTLVYIVRSGAGRARALAYLLVYNLAFILPLVLVFAVTYQGMKIHRLLAWSEKNVVISKLLLGMFFIALAGLIAIM